MATATTTRARAHARRITAARRRPAVSNRIRPHVPYSRSDTPGVCGTCNLVITTRPDGTYTNDLHMTMDQWLQALIAADAAVDFRSVAAGDG